MRLAPAALVLLFAASAGTVVTETLDVQRRPGEPLARRQIGGTGAGNAARFDPRAFVESHCIACHNDRARIGGLSLSTFDGARITDAELSEKVLHKIRTGQMPPAPRPRPEAASSRAMVAWLELALDREAAARPHAGRVGVHRLNRTEYGNAVRDLFGLEIDTAKLLLPDEADEGFDNVAANLALSPAHLERYMSAARLVSQLAVGSATSAATSSQVYRVPRLLEQNVRTSEDLPFGSRGGIAIRHQFVLDGEYVLKVRLRRQVYDYIIGMGTAQQLDIRLDGRRVKRFTVGGEAQGRPGPLTWNGEVVGDREYELYMHAADAGLEVRIPVKAGTHLVTASFVDNAWEPETVKQPPAVDFARGSDERYDGHAAVDSLTIHGPYHPGGAGDTESRRRVFVCRPTASGDEERCARQILSSLARRAYRRQPTVDEVQTLLTFFRTGRQQGGFEQGIQTALERMLISFNFLFRIESPPARAANGAIYRLSESDLASRLSFFLWSSIPDEELLTLAGRGTLDDPKVLEQQVRRMLHHPRAKALVDGLATSWLTLRKVQSWQPDLVVHPEFDENLRAAFQRETLLFLESQLVEDRSIVDLISADYSFVNERLARHYGMPGVYGERFRRVTFSDGVRGGLLGQGGLLMVTSYPDRTAPVLRGFWVLDSLLGMPPPPPPQDVPDLPPEEADGQKRSIREQMEVHRQNPACAACHVRMDPLGFALENFDAIGRWRTTSRGVAVDAAATFPDGTPIDGVRGLRAFVLSHRDSYAETVSAKLLTYALGRLVDHRDRPAIRKIVREAAANDYRWSSIIMGVVRSTPFQFASVSPASPAGAAAGR
jgi:mono/diheme cytochrome c family protein